ncbi:MAG: hypothetical protein HY830_26225, partial [Actinobacteria bacterium]|nr:hypothetical protein [Actinomycetota bacterium]
GAPGGYPAAAATDSKVKTALYLGIAGIVMALCCSIVGLGLGIASVVMATQAEKQGLPGNAQTAKIVGFVAIGLGALSLVGGLFLGLGNVFTGS